MVGTAEGTVVDVPGERDDDHSRCRYCGRRFADPDLLALHRGVEHAGELNEGEREAFGTAYDAEEDELRLFRLKALLALMVLYFSLLFAYSVFG